jgi:hypothetical protein
MTNEKVEALLMLTLKDEILILTARVNFNP